MLFIGEFFRHPGGEPNRWFVANGCLNAKKSYVYIRKSLDDVKDLDLMISNIYIYIDVYIHGITPSHIMAWYWMK